MPRSTLVAAILPAFLFIWTTARAETLLEKIPFKEVYQQADSGNAEYQEELARRYFKGEGVPRDGAQGVDWLTEAAQSGRTESQYNLALVLIGDLQEGVTLDYETAALWCRKAAEKGHVKALALLGLLYWSATGVPQDFRQARQYLEAASAKGD